MSPREEGVAAIEAISGGSRGGLPGLDIDLPGAHPATSRQQDHSQTTRSGPEPLESLLAKLRPEGTRLTVEKDRESGEMVVKILDPKSGEVIRQIPRQEMLKIAESIDRYLGLMVDKRS